MLAFLTLVACVDEKAPAKDGAVPDDSAAEPSLCEVNGFGREVPWNADGPYGTHRHELADDFEVPLSDGSTWRLSEHWTGCESFVFVPDSIPRADGDDRSIWSRDVDALIAASPRNVHYFFVSTERDADDDAASLAVAQEQIDDALADLSADDAAWWGERLHAVSGPAKDLDNWVESVLLRGVGTNGFSIDRAQTIRGMGGLSDVNRYDASASWPFEYNLVYASYEARYFNMEAERQLALDAEDATLVPVLTGEVVSQYAEADVELPSAEDMATFDTFEIDVDMRCPDPDGIEYGNCGAWDYLAYLWLEEDDGSWTELGRFITSYHRETHWVFDATPMMVHLLDGGTRHLKWEWAPEWNVQPTETRLTLRFSDQGKGYRPRALTKVATGGSLGSTYNDGRDPVDVDIPADAAKVQLWALITGHGANTNSCAEFCDHQHEFTVDGNVHLQEYPMAGTADGCVSEIEGQMTPNQWGTWWYGRGGWCPGEMVHPYDVDVTGEVTPGGTASVSYRGLYDGDTAPDGSGDIVLNAWMVVYE